MVAQQAQEEEARLLFGGRWQPVTRHLTFVEGRVDEVVQAFLAWRGKYEHERTGFPYLARSVPGDLEALLTQLQPLAGAAGPPRLLFVPTMSNERQDTAWTLAHSNHLTGTESGRLAPPGRRWISVSSAANTLDSRTNRGGYGVHLLRVAWPDPSALSGFRSRAVGVAQFDSHRRWDFVDNGDPLPFEDVSRYSAPRVRDRFTQAMLVDYAEALGLFPFDPAFYAPDQAATLVTHAAPPEPGAYVTDLAGARAGKLLKDVGWPATSQN